MTYAAGSGPFLEVVHRQRACRRFKPDAVSDDLLEVLFDAACQAPSAENRQPWEFLVVRDPDAREAIGRLYRLAWTGGAKDATSRRVGADLLVEVDAGAMGGIAGAPVLVVVCGDEERGHPTALASSVFPAVQNLLLTATAMGLGSALTTLAVLHRGPVADLLGLPGHVRPMAIIPIGWPARVLGPPVREPGRSRAHRERYGQPW